MTTRTRSDPRHSRRRHASARYLQWYLQWYLQRYLQRYLQCGETTEPRSRWRQRSNEGTATPGATGESTTECSQTPPSRPASRGSEPSLWFHLLVSPALSSSRTRARHHLPSLPDAAGQGNVSHHERQRDEQGPPARPQLPRSPAPSVHRPLRRPRSGTRRTSAHHHRRRRRRRVLHHATTCPATTVLAPPPGAAEAFRRTGMMTS